MRAQQQHWFYFACKRLLDTLIAGSALIVLSPLMLVIAILIKIDSPGPAIFKQKRVGARRRTDGQRETWTVCTFTLHKFRTILRRTIGRFLEDDVRNIEGLLGRRLDMWRQGYAG